MRFLAILVVLCIDGRIDISCAYSVIRITDTKKFSLDKIVLFHSKIVLKEVSRITVRDYPALGDVIICSYIYVIARDYRDQPFVHIYYSGLAIFDFLLVFSFSFLTFLFNYSKKSCSGCSCVILKFVVGAIMFNACSNVRYLTV
jgi:hypothetical protein